MIEQKHVLKGASAVIEKDSIAGKLAADLKADQLIILTSVPCVYKNFGTDSQEELSALSADQAKACMQDGQFGENDMLPKIEAAISYLSACPSGSVLITSLDRAADAVRGRAGTVITS